MSAIRRLSVLALLLAAVVQAAERPNILFIYSDDHSYRTVGAYPQSYPWVRTPTIDKLAAEGVRFEYAYIGSWCMPSRATLLTGKHQFAVESMRMEGPYPGSEYDPAKSPFWPKVFRQNGYFTAQIGKWHTGTDTGYGRDWDFQIVWNRPKHPETSAHYYYDQPVTYQGGKTEMLKRYSTDQYTDWAVDLINGKDRPADKPWYLWLCYGAVHGPFTPADRHLEEYKGIDFDTPKDVFAPRPGKPEWAQKVNHWERGPNGQPFFKGRSIISWVQQYHQGVLALDEGIARVMDALEKSGQRKNTLVIFTSDQGLAWGQHGFRGTKIAAYDANIRSPMIISMPSRLPQGTVVEKPVNGVDIVPTIFSFAGIEQPWKFQGQDLTPLLENPDAPWERPAMLVATGQKFGSDTNVIPKGAGAFHSDVPWYVMIRHGKYKYVRPLIEDLEELYDLKADPDELDNLAVKADFQDKLKEMRAMAISELRRNGAGFVDNMPQVKSGL
ncbi:MAG: sulfatase-like hydrolase/transferase [Acidobacteria bacterium]|nr:sulfatase-like hydrolase/transferase [Acidobacteriota bacterium]